MEENMKTLKAYENEIYNKRSSKDNRKKIDWYLVSYEDEQGYEYRKSFEFSVGTSWQEVKNLIPLIIA